MRALFPAFSKLAGLGRAAVVLALAVSAAIGAADAAPANKNPAPTAPAPAAPVPAPAAAAPAPVPAEPGLTTASFGDWILRCQRSEAGGAAPTRLCEVGVAISVQGQPNPVARLAIGRLKKGDPLRLTVLLPANVSFPSVVHVGLAKGDAGGVDLPWHRCVPGACVADTEMKDDILKAWRGTVEQGRIAFKDSVGRDIVLPMSFKGLDQALDAYTKEARDM